jgi:hypothetical protein
LPKNLNNCPFLIKHVFVYVTDMEIG